MRLKLELKFLTDQGERFFGEGPYQLLIRVDRLGSLHAGAQEMGMAYTKAFRLVKAAEKAMGFPLLERTVGGKGGGGSVLTPQAKELLKRYETYRTACSRMAEQLYQESFSDFLPQAPVDYGRKGQGQDNAAGVTGTGR